MERSFRGRRKWFKHCVHFCVRGNGAFFAKTPGKITSDVSNIISKINKSDISVLTSSSLKRQNRINTASDFLQKNLGKSNLDINRMLNSAIDYARSVKVMTLEKGTIVYRYERTIGENAEKHFFTDSYTAMNGPGAVGLSSSGYTLKAYKLLEDVEVLETAVKGTRGNSTQLIFNGTDDVIENVPLKKTP